MPVHTRRLILRVYREADYEYLRELDGDPQVLKFRSRSLITPEMTRESLTKMLQSPKERPRLHYAYAVVKQDSQEWLGQCGMTVISPQTGEAFVWYSLLPRYWGQGYMAEALRALIHAGFTRFKLNRIFAECHPDNLASERVMQKAGMLKIAGSNIGRPGDETYEPVRYSLDAHAYRLFKPPDLVIKPPL